MCVLLILCCNEPDTDVLESSGNFTTLLVYSGVSLQSSLMTFELRSDSQWFILKMKVYHAVEMFRYSKSYNLRR